MMKNQTIILFLFFLISRFGYGAESSNTNLEKRIMAFANPFEMWISTSSKSNPKLSELPQWKKTNRFQCKILSNSPAILSLTKKDFSYSYCVFKTKFRSEKHQDFTVVGSGYIIKKELRIPIQTVSATIISATKLVSSRILNCDCVDIRSPFTDKENHALKEMIHHNSQYYPGMKQIHSKAHSVKSIPQDDGDGSTIPGL